MNNPLNLRRVRQEPDTADSAVDSAHIHRPRRTLAKSFLGCLVLLFVAAAAVRFYQSERAWRAVFLSNNQVYFGRFFSLPFWPNGRLTDIYYLEVSQSIQPQGNTAPQPELKVVKLGNEIHGPMSKMIIPMSHVLFWEDLRSDSAVVKAILESENLESRK